MKKSGKKPTEQDFLPDFHFPWSKGAAQSSKTMILRHPHFFYSLLISV